jgi:hypothetical protein
MKKYFLALFIYALFFLNVAYAATYYVDASRPDDSGNGLSTAAAWKTINKVNAANLLPGDVVLFRRGQVFRGMLVPNSGSSSAIIRYGAYGSGVKPLLLGSINKNGIANWVSVGTNLWKTTNVRTVTGNTSVDAGNIIFNWEQSVGWKVFSLAQVSSQGKFWSDPDHTNNKGELTLYSVGNPGSVYSNIEIALWQNNIDQTNKSYITYENLDLRYSGQHGIGGGNTHHITVKECNFSFIGGSVQPNTPTVRLGNGVEFWENSNNSTVERCTFSQIYDCALSPQGLTRGYQAYNLYFNNNIIDKCEQTFEIWTHAPLSAVHDVYFMNNTCTNAGGGWGHAQRPDKNGCFLQGYGWDSTSTVHNIFIMNNIFSNATQAGVLQMDWPDIDTSKMTINFNDWSVVNQYGKHQWNSNGYTTPLYSNWSTYRSTINQDANSIISNPLLNSDFTLPANSPCVNVGTSSPGITYDFVLIPRPQGVAPDIGAYEYKPSAQAFTLLPIGDSMTEGQESTSGAFRSYRGTLYNKFVAAGYTPNFLGPKYSVPAVGGDPDHAGYGGYQIGPSSTKNNIDAQLPSIFKVASNPTVIVMAFGWNSIYQEPAVAATKYCGIVNKVRTTWPNSRIIVATVPPQKGQTEAETQAQLLAWGNVAYGDVNAQARSLANASATDNIFLADLASGPYLSSGYWDVIHFLQGNADIEAEIIFEAVKIALGSSGTSTPTHGPGSTENDQSGQKQ